MHSSDLCLQYEHLYENNPCAYATLDSKGIITRCNLAARMMLIGDKIDLNGQDFYQYIAPESKDSFEHGLQKAIHNSGRHRMDISIARPSGEIIWVCMDIQIFHIDSSETWQCHLVFMDITEHRQTLEELHDSRLFLQMINDNLTSGMIYQVKQETPESHTFTYLSESVRKFYGISPEEGMADADLIYGKVHPDDRMMVVQREAEAAEKMTTFRTEVRMLTPSGDIRWSQFVSNPRRLKDGSIGWDGIEFDITERKRTEAMKLEIESEKRFRQYIDCAPDAVFVSRLDGTLLEVNQASTALTGYTRDELLGMNLNFLIRNSHPEDLMFVRENLKTFGIANRDITYTTKNETDKICSTHLVQLPDERYLGISRDVTERRREQDALALFKNLVYQSSDILMIIDPSTRRFLDVNDQACKSLGYSRDELLSKTVFDIEATITDVEKWNFYLAKLHSAGSGFLEGTHIRKDGSTYPVEANVKWVAGKTANYIIAIIRDLTDRKMREETQKKVEKLQNLQGLATSVYHDFNNILTSLCRHVQNSKSRICHDHPASEYLENAENSLELAKSLIDQLKTFSSEYHQELEDFKLDQVIQEVIHGFAFPNLIPVLKAPEDLWLVRADKRQIYQIFSNLIVNSHQATPLHGHFYVTLENAELNRDQISCLKPGKYIKIVVKDEGTGIEQSQLDHIFESRFTTKEKGKGLGLYTTYSIIQQHKGFINAESALGNGTTFTLYLPATDIKPAIKKAEQAPHPAIIPKTMRILVMDDDEIILCVTKEMLEYLGVTVETATHGQMAIEMYRQSVKSGTPFNALIMDINIPYGKGAIESIKDILTDDPTACAFLSTGFTDDQTLSSCEKLGFKGILSKPYSIDDLWRLLTQVIKNQ